MEDKIVALSLTVADLNVMLNILGQGQYVTVAPLIDKVRAQANDQLSKAAAIDPDN